MGDDDNPGRGPTMMTNNEELRGVRTRGTSARRGPNDVSLGPQTTCHHPHPLTTPTAVNHCSRGGTLPSPEDDDDAVITSSCSWLPPSLANDAATRNGKHNGANQSGRGTALRTSGEYSFRFSVRRHLPRSKTAPGTTTTAAAHDNKDHDKDKEHGEDEDQDQEEDGDSDNDNDHKDHQDQDQGWRRRRR